MNMKRWRKATLLILFACGGCTSVQLSRAALRAERREQFLAERGDGVGAARARDRAAALHLQAQARIGRGDWLNR